LSGRIGADISPQTVWTGDTTAIWPSAAIRILSHLQKGSWRLRDPGGLVDLPLRLGRPLSLPIERASVLTFLSHHVASYVLKSLARGAARTSRCRLVGSLRLLHDTRAQLDDARSPPPGKQMATPLVKAIRRLEAGDVLVVTRLDRLARSTRDLLNILDAVGKAGAGFKSLKDTWADTTTPQTMSPGSAMSSLIWRPSVARAEPLRDNAFEAPTRKRGGTRCRRARQCPR